MTAEEMQRVRLPLWLGLAGLGPFLVCAVSAYLLPMRWQALAVDVFVIYGAIVLSFLGGVHWGVAISLDRSGTRDFNARLLVSIVPGLLAWPALMLDYIEAAAILMVGFWLIRLYERQQDSAERLPGWYQGLRTLLNTVVVLCHLAIIARLTLLG